MKEKLRIMDEAIQKITLLRKETEDLSVPPELQTHHKKRLEALELSLKLHKFLRRNPERYPGEISWRDILERYPGEIFSEMQIKALEEMQELRRVYIQEGAPPEVISQIDMEISYGKQIRGKLEERMKKLYE